jgi:hypothetical protein
MSPDKSDDLTTVINECRGEFVVIWSSENAEHDATYRELGRFPTRAKAEAFVRTN